MMLPCWTTYDTREDSGEGSVLDIGVKLFPRIRGMRSVSR